jgi:hypothetical protein
MWIITRDLLFEDTPNTGNTKSRAGVHSADYDEARFARADTLEIRLLDDDGEVYYEGRITRRRLEGAEDRAFEVLDWAMADAGCTELQFYDKGRWETL